MTNRCKKKDTISKPPKSEDSEINDLAVVLELSPDPSIASISSISPIPDWVEQSKKIMETFKTFEDSIRGTVKEHIDVMNNHANLINGHASLINSHAGIINDHTRCLKNHADRIDEQAKLINEQAKTIVDLQNRIQELEGKIEKSEKHEDNGVPHSTMNQAQGIVDFADIANKIKAIEETVKVSRTWAEVVKDPSQVISQAMSEHEKRATKALNIRVRGVHFGSEHGENIDLLKASQTFISSTFAIPETSIVAAWKGKFQPELVFMRFKDQKSRLQVLRKRNSLRGTNQFIDEDLTPIQWNERKRWYAEAKSKNQRVIFRDGRPLFVSISSSSTSTVVSSSLVLT